jgi:YD repeat-containing protein
VRAKDPWNRERWARFDEQNRLVEVVEPKEDGDGTVASNGYLTKHSYDTLGRLMLVEQGAQTRSFKHDGLGRLTHQKLAEREATLNDAGQHRDAGGAGPWNWSDVFSYDTRSNLIWRVDARGVKTFFNYDNDPLNRLQSVSHNKSGVPPAQQSSIIDAASVTYAYVTAGDRRRLQSVTLSDNVGNESFDYDTEFRLDQRTQTFPNLNDSLVTSYTWDTLDRLWKLSYPKQHGASELTKTVEHSFDLASRISSASYASATLATVSEYNAASQTLGLSLGNSLTENYTYDAQTGLLTNQTVKQGATTLVELIYGYNDANGKKTGQLLSLTDIKNSRRSRNYSYDKLGRLSQVSGTSSGGAWQQSYSYDRYGNRGSVTRSGAGAAAVPLDAIADTGNPNTSTFLYNTTSNRITTDGYSYDAAGNLITGQAPDGSWQYYKYDAAGRLVEVRANNQSGTLLASYSYGASNQRLIASDNQGAVVTTMRGTAVRSSPSTASRALSSASRRAFSTWEEGCWRPRRVTRACNIITLTGWGRGW